MVGAELFCLVVGIILPTFLIVFIKYRTYRYGSAFSPKNLRRVSFIMGIVFVVLPIVVVILNIAMVLATEDEIQGVRTLSDLTKIDRAFQSIILGVGFILYGIGKDQLSDKWLKLGRAKKRP